MTHGMLQARARASMRTLEGRSAAAAAQRSALQEEQEAAVSADDFERAGELGSQIDELTATMETASRQGAQQQNRFFVVRYIIIFGVL